MYKRLLERDRLKDPDNGVQYFKDTLRPHFVKGAQSVFLWRLFQFMRLRRGTLEMIRWLGKFALMKKRLHDAWMDLLPVLDQTSQEFYKGKGKKGKGKGKGKGKALTKDLDTSLAKERKERSRDRKIPLAKESDIKQKTKVSQQQEIPNSPHKPQNRQQQIGQKMAGPPGRPRPIMGGKTRLGMIRTGRNLQQDIHADFMLPYYMKKTTKDQIGPSMAESSRAHS